jgi:small subunit ribosomal protein S21
MLEVNIASNDRFEGALKRFSKLVQQSGIMREARQRRFFEPPSAARKRKAANKLRKSRKAAGVEAGERQIRQAGRGR